MIAVLTGDVISSSRIDSSKRAAFAEVLVESLDPKNLTSVTADLGKVRMEVFRGDSFQIVLDQAHSSHALLAALLVLLQLRVNGARRGMKIESRIGIGIGNLSYGKEDQSIGLWSGEAFELASASLLGASVTDRNRISLRTTWGGRFDEGVNAALGLLDFMIARWTDKECEAVLGVYKMRLLTRIAPSLGISTSAVSQRLMSGGWWAVRDFEKEIRLQLAERLDQES